jgi:hypothetical protein
MTQAATGRHGFLYKIRQLTSVRVARTRAYLLGDVADEAQVRAVDRQQRDFLRSRFIADIATEKPSARLSSYSLLSMAWSSRKRVFPVLPPREITKGTCPCREVLA